VRVQKHLSTSLIDVDVHPTYVSVVIKSKVLRLRLPAEVACDGTRLRRVTSTGVLVVDMPRVRAVLTPAVVRGVEGGKGAAVGVGRGLSAALLADARTVPVVSSRKEIEGLLGEKFGGLGRGEGMGLVEAATTRRAPAQSEEGDDDGPPPLR